MDKERKTLFERKIQPILQYIGMIGAIFMSIVYIVLVCILIVGFKAQTFTQILIFALVNAGVGLIIMQFLKIQGISFAKNLPENKAILEEYYKGKRKNRKYKSIKVYWLQSVLFDVLSKGVSVALSTCGMIYIVIQGCHDYTLILLAIVNLIMFTCFGLLSLNSAYDFFNNEHIPFIINQLENKITQGDVEKCLHSMVNNSET